MATDNRRAEGRRPPRRGRSERMETDITSAISDQASNAPGEAPSHEEARQPLRQRGRSQARWFDKQTWN